MPDVGHDSLDEAFAALTTDVARGSRPPGAPGAMRLARRRRATTLAAATAVLAVVVGGGLVWGQSGRDDASPDVANPSGVRALPAPAVLDADALTEATEGWQGPWRLMTGNEAATAGDFMGCTEALEAADDQADPARAGSTLMVDAAGNQVFATFGDFGSRARAGNYADLLRSVFPQCTGTSAGDDVDYAGARSSHYRLTSGPQARQEIWVVETGERLAVAFVQNNGVGAASDETALQVADALVAATQDDTSLNDAVDSSGDDGASDDHTSSQSVWERQLRLALEPWDRGDTADETKGGCLNQDWLGATVSASGTAISQGAEALTASFGSEGDAELAMAELDRVLSSCDSRAWTTTGTPDASQPTLVATSTGGAVWASYDANQLSAVVVHGEGPPPESVVNDVLDLVRIKPGASE